VSLPMPPADLPTRKPALVTIAAGAELHRFHTASFDPIFFDRSDLGRFNAPDASYGVLYCAETDAGALAETFLRTPGRRMVDPGLLAAKGYARLTSTAELTLISMVGPGLDGIAYRSRHDPDKICYALFDTTAGVIAELDRTTDLDADWFWECADVYKLGRAPS